MKEFGRKPLSVTGTDADETITGTPGPDFIDGAGGNDTLNGLASDDVLVGGTGNDTLDGGTGGDVMTGNAGDDTFYVDNPDDRITEATGEGFDRLFAADSYYLPAGAEVEEMRAINAASTQTLHLTGNEYGQALYGDAGFNRLDGGGGADTMTGFGGSDWYYVDNPGDAIVEAANQGWDRVYTTVSYVLGAGVSVEEVNIADRFGTEAIDLTGNAFHQYLTGNAGNNVFDPGGGEDIMTGLGGDDTYYTRDFFDTIREAVGGGYDRVYIVTTPTSPSAPYLDFNRLNANAEIEEIRTADPQGTAQFAIYGNNFSQSIFGNEGNNTLVGLGGDDTLVGGGGNDGLYGGTGQDTLMGEAGADELSGGDGDDSLNGGDGNDILNGEAGADVLVGGDGHDKLSGGADNDTLDGGAGVDLLFGGDGQDNLSGGDDNDVLDGEAGADTMAGGLSFDWFYVDNAGDSVNEAAGEGWDRVYASASYSLTAGAEVEEIHTTDLATGTAAIDLTGNAFGQYLFGNNGVNRLDGGAGADALFGYGGADQFAFTTALSSDTIDNIGDFAPGADKILLDDAIFTGLAPGALDPNAFRSGSAAQDADDRVIYDPATGALYFDADGNGAGARVQFAILQGAPVIAASDFIVI
jgi:Ca2+-binding RTX toxin-like protein